MRGAGVVWDAVVVGAGPAGAMTAHELARAGASVLMLERTPFPRWKVCGSCLSPGTQQTLGSAGLGHLLPGMGARPLHALRVGGWGVSAELSLGTSVAVSRSARDAALVEAATAAGAAVINPARARLGAARGGYRAVTVESEEGEEEVQARVVVAADGLGSPLLTAALGPRAPADGGVAPGAPIGFGALFPADTPGFPPGVIHMAVGAGGYVGLVRLEDGTLDVAAALAARGAGGVAGERPEGAVARLLEGAGFPRLEGTPLHGWKGTPRLTRTLPTRGAERLLAVGDAAGYVEPFTGEGVGWALAGARALAPLALEGIRAWDPGLVAEWDRTYGRTIGAQARLCRGIAWALRRPTISRAGIRLLRTVPAVAGPFVRWAGRAPAQLQWSTP